MPWPTGQTRTSTAEHKRWANVVLRNAAGRCQLQIADDCTGVAVHADHTVAVAEGGDELDPANGQGACEPCHTIKTREETARGRQRFYGSARRQPERHPSAT